ncbi:hypothetical protein GR198_10715 [Rhizobium leguminosarum]|uniref:hypothetical protein n=1 Tax=Rhizobium leguminosarum TaxID=384 RepID=UPI0013C0E5E2|nr:hypothetical protein [Rhizobium leguminosarum]MBY5393821.1 hypothetical protein [Rhizobium leguminosarum]NEH56207.1 hypothetical protein [Rhizobium leguminosarum]
MTHEDLTIVDVLKDPLIRLVMRADHVSVKTMKALLVHAAHKQGVGLGNSKHQHVAKNLSAKAHPVTHPHSAGTDARRL